MWSLLKVVHLGCSALQRSPLKARKLQWKISQTQGAGITANEVLLLSVIVMYLLKLIA